MSSDPRALEFATLLQRLQQAHDNEISSLHAEVARLRSQNGDSGDRLEWSQMRQISPDSDGCSLSETLKSPTVAVLSQTARTLKPETELAPTVRIGWASTEEENGAESPRPSESPRPNVSPRPTGSSAVIAVKKNSANKKKRAPSTRGFVLDSMDTDMGDDFGWRATNLADLVMAPLFEIFFAGLIMIAVIVMALETQFEGENTGDVQGLTSGSGLAHSWRDAKHVFEILGWILGVFFTLELVLKLIALRVDYFKDALNWLDFFVVTFWLAGKCGLQMGSKAHTVRIIRLVRLFRLLRMAQSAEALDCLFLMTAALKGSFLTLGWVIILFFLVLSLFALIMCQTLTVFYFQDASQPLEHRQQLWVYFGTFTRSVFTMFELTFANWPPVSRLLIEYVHGFFMIGAVLYKLTLGFAVVGVINGVFMQETFKVSSLNDNLMIRQKRKATQAHTKKMYKLFRAADKSKDGQLDRDEFGEIWKHAEVREWLSAMDFPVCETEEAVHKLFEEFDHGRTGTISRAELVRGVAKLKGHARSSDVLALLGEVREIRSLLAAYHGYSETVAGRRFSSLRFVPIEENVPKAPALQTTS